MPKVVTFIDSGPVAISVPLRYHLMLSNGRLIVAVSVKGVTEPQNILSAPGEIKATGAGITVNDLLTVSGERHPLGAITVAVMVYPVLVVGLA